MVTPKSARAVLELTGEAVSTGQDVLSEYHGLFGPILTQHPSGQRVRSA